jgi:hypothetical protein
MNQQDYLNQFRKIYANGVPSQGSVGDRAAAYIFAALVQNRSDLALQDAATGLIKSNSGKTGYLADAFQPLRRDRVGEICRDESVDPVVAYCFAMAWGGQWQASSYGSFVDSLSDINRLRGNLVILRRLKAGAPGRSTARMEAFDLFTSKSPIKGLGISYFTKLLYFFLPNYIPAYVLDNWTAKSVSKLAEHADMPIQDWIDKYSKTSRWPGPKRKPEKTSTYGQFIGNIVNWKTSDHYEQYCQFIEDLAGRLKWDGGASDVELALFGSTDEGSTGKIWRNLVEPPKRSKRTNQS